MRGISSEIMALPLLLHICADVCHRNGKEWESLFLVHLWSIISFLGYLEPPVSRSWLQQFPWVLQNKSSMDYLQVLGYSRRVPQLNKFVSNLVETKFIHLRQDFPESLYGNVYHESSREVWETQRAMFLKLNWPWDLLLVEPAVKQVFQGTSLEKCWLGVLIRFL